jgi:thiol-disulfide isomerase/thioredoxin
MKYLQIILLSLRKKLGNMKNIRILTLLIPAILLISCSSNGDKQASESTQTRSNVVPPGLVDEAKAKELIQNATFTDLEGNEVSIDRFEGKVVLIDFWETWCGPCLQVFPAMDKLRDEYENDFEVLAVTVGLSDTVEDAVNFANENDYDFNFLIDSNNIFDQLGASGIPFKVLVNPNGELIKIEMGSRGTEGDYNQMKSIILEYI